MSSKAGKRRALTPREQRKADKSALRSRRAAVQEAVEVVENEVVLAGPSVSAPSQAFTPPTLSGVPDWDSLYTPIQAEAPPAPPAPVAPLPELDSAPDKGRRKKTQAKKRRRPVRLLVDFMAITALVGGLISVGWFGWQYTGTNIVANHRAGEVKEKLTQKWDDGKDFDGAIALIRVERFGKSWEKPVIRGVDTDSLARGVGWNPLTNKPGEIGNFVVAGHRVTNGEPFRDFPALMAGDEVEIETLDRIYTYRLTNSGTSLSLPFTTTWVQQPVPTKDGLGERPVKQMLTMYTCASLFHTDYRNVVFGELIRDIVKSQPETPEKQSKKDSKSDKLAAAQNG